MWESDASSLATAAAWCDATREVHQSARRVYNITGMARIWSRCIGLSAAAVVYVRVMNALT